MEMNWKLLKPQTEKNLGDILLSKALQSISQKEGKLEADQSEMFYLEKDWETR